ncbi:hypothetical protein [Teredinibacter purpureus]|uniref:hypothetical protein n=1 Tax=Teredinibacter purpureus TaxID=2731756 RepID=UPI0005F7FB36|nr:hypothetical protein [Teredinibacter purpureus]
MKLSTCYLTALLSVFIISGCATSKHPNGAVERHHKQATKKQASTGAAIGAAALCGAVANKTASKKHRDTATVVSAALCGAVAYSGVKSGYESETLNRAEKHLMTILRPGISITRSETGKTISLVFSEQWENVPGNSGIRMDMKEDYEFIAKTLTLFPTLQALVATADPTDSNFKGIGYDRAKNIAMEILKHGAPKGRIRFTSLGNSPKGAVTQFDFSIYK